MFIPLLSMSLLMLGSGFINTVCSLKLKMMGYSSFFVGIITSLFYLGMFLGSFNISHILIRVSYIRTYAAFASLFAFSILILAISDNLLVWSVSRFIAGYCLAGLYITIESWLLNVSNERNRSSYLALYVASIYGAQSVGQLFIDIIAIETMIPFIFAAGFVVLSVIPFCATPIVSPKISDPKALGIKKLFAASPTGVVGSFVSGLFIAATYGLLPIYVIDEGVLLDNVSIVMSLNIIGGVVLQYPFGLLSDRIDRRLALVILCVVASIVSIFIMFLDYFPMLSSDVSKIVSLALIFVLGGIIFCIFPISMNHMCDYIEKKHIIEATQGLSVAYGLGAVFGPLIIASFMKVLGAIGFFIGMSALFAITAIYTLYRVIKSRIPLEAQSAGVIVVPGAIPLISELELKKDN
jgi:MFS family permease